MNAQSEIGSKKIKTVVIDPGHGGRDPGAIGKTGSKEKEIVLSIGLKLGKLIQQRFPDVQVIYTRNEDKFIELYQRADIANKAKADLFISVHANSTTKSSPSGVEFWVLGLNKADENLEVVKKENAALSFEQDVRKNYGFDPNSPEGSIIMTMQQGVFLDQSIQFAKLVESRFVKEDNQLNRGTKQAGFIVLYKTSMPSVLVEVGFVSNPDEEQYISNDNGQDRIASNIANAFADYKMKYESGAIKPASNSSVNRVPATPPVEKASDNINTNAGFSSSSTNINSKIIVEDAPLPEVVKKEIPPITPTEMKPSSPKSDVLIDNTQKRKIVIDEEMDKYSSSLPVRYPTKTEVKEVPKPSIKTPSSSSIIDNIDKKKIVLEEEVPVGKATTVKDIQVLPKVTKTSSASPVSESKVSISTVSKEKVKEEIVNKTLKKNETLESNSDNSIPSYIKSEDIKKEIVDNTRNIGSSNSKEIISTVTPKSVVSSEIKASTVQSKIKPISISENIIYKIQIKAASAKIKPVDPILSMEESIEESFENGLYKYLVGNSKSESEASLILQRIREKGIKDAFVVKYKDGVRIK